LLAVVFVLAFGCATAPPAKYFEDLEHQWVAALQAHDTATLNELLDASFVDSTFRGGTRTKHDVLTGPPAGGAYKSVRLEDMTVRLYGRRTAIVTGVNVLQGRPATSFACDSPTCSPSREVPGARSPRRRRCRRRSRSSLLARSAGLALTSSLFIRPSSLTLPLVEGRGSREEEE